MVTRELIESKLSDNIPLTKGEKIAWSNIKRSHPALEISPDAEQIIIGSLLGDGSIIKKNTNCVLSVNHSLVQHQYAFYKVCLLLREGIRTNFIQSNHSYKQGCINGRKIKDNGFARFITETNVAFNKFRDEWYTPTKQVPDSVSKLGPLGLAIWYMDDGALHNPTGLYLSTNGFNHESQLKLVNVLKDNFDIIAHIHKNQDKEILFIVQKDRDKFFDIIRPHICSSMKYKLGEIDKPATKEELLKLEAELFRYSN